MIQELSSAGSEHPAALLAGVVTGSNPVVPTNKPLRNLGGFFI
jgi:hypothetical protein